MAEKGFGVKEINLIGPSGTPTITSPNNLNLNANNVAISTNVSIGGTLSVTGNVSVGGTLTYEDVTSIDSVGIVTARDGVVVVGRGVSIAAGGLNVTAGVGTFAADIYANSGQIRKNGVVWLGKDGGDECSYTAGTSGGGGDNHLFRTFYGGSIQEIIRFDFGAKIGIAGANYGTSGQVLTSGGSGSAASWSDVSVTPTNSDIQVVYTVTANGSSAYRFAGNGVVSTADNPDLYLIRGKKYRFINNSGGSHPFQIREASGGTAYSTGVTNNGASSGNIDFAPTFDSPAQLVYQCTVHGGMVGNIYLRGGSGNETNVGVTTFTTPTGWVHGTETSLNGNVVVIENGVPDGASHIRYLFRYVSVNSTSQPFCQIELNNNGTIKNSNFQTASTTTRGGSPQISGDSDKTDGLTLWNGYTNAGNVLHGVLNIYRIGTNGTDGTNYYMEFHGMGNSNQSGYDATHSAQGYFELGTGSTDYVSGLRLSTGNGSVQFDNGYIQQSYILS